MLRFKFLFLISSVVFILFGCSRIKPTISDKNTSRPPGINAGISERQTETSRSSPYPVQIPRPLGIPQTPIPYPPPDFGNRTPTPLIYPLPIGTNTPTPTLITLSTPLTDQEVSAKIAACYHPSSGCSACLPKLNNSVQYVKETVRAFINLPKDLYPKYILTKEFIITINGTASIGYISNGGLPGEAFDSTSECWSTYIEFGGSGEVDLRVKSVIKGVPDYFVRFIVQGLPGGS